MARIVGVDIPNDKRVLIGLTYIFGIGRYSAQCILEKAGVDINIRVRDLTPSQINDIKKIIDTEFTIEGELRRKVNFDIKRLMDIGCYRGLRHRKGLPVRGQNTKNNARTRKGKKKIVTKRK